MTRRETGLTLTLRGLRFVRDATLDGLVTHDSKTGSVYAALTLRAADGSSRAFVLTWNTNQVEGLRRRARQRRRAAAAARAARALEP